MLIANPAALRQYNDRCRQIGEQERQLEQVRWGLAGRRAAPSQCGLACLGVPA